MGDCKHHMKCKSGRDWAVVFSAKVRTQQWNKSLYYHPLLQSGFKICHSTNNLSAINFQNAVLYISTRKFPWTFNCNFRDVNLFGALLLPSEVRPCQASCPQTNLEDPKAQTKTRSQQKMSFSEKWVSTYLNTISTKKVLFGEMGFQQTST